MKWANRLSLVVAGLITAKSIRDFFSKYDILIFDKNDVEQARQEMQQYNSMDLRGNPTHECVCGSHVFFIKAIFENYEIATYFLDMQCVECGSLATAPTPVDREITE